MLDVLQIISVQNFLHPAGGALSSIYQVNLISFSEKQTMLSLDRQLTRSMYTCIKSFS